MQLLLVALSSILLTTHDTQDIEQIAQRLMLIDNGKLLFDGTQEAFHEKYQGSEYMIEIEFVHPTPQIDHDFFRPHNVEGTRHSYWVPYNKLGRGEAISYVATLPTQSLFL